MASTGPSLKDIKLCVSGPPTSGLQFLASWFHNLLLSDHQLSLVPMDPACYSCPSMTEYHPTKHLTISRCSNSCRIHRWTVPLCLSLNKSSKEKTFCQLWLFVDSLLLPLELLHISSVAWTTSSGSCGCGSLLWVSLESEIWFSQSLPVCNHKWEQELAVKQLVFPSNAAFFHHNK